MHNCKYAENKLYSAASVLLHSWLITLHGVRSKSQKQVGVDTPEIGRLLHNV